MNGKIALIGSFATDWIRYSNYELKENDKGTLYIVPTKDAAYSMYNPFNVAEDLLIDLMEIGQIVLKLDKKKGRPKSSGTIKRNRDLCQKIWSTGLN